MSMNELGKQLSLLSFGIIAVIVLIGLIQKRQWLEMFTIGGKISLSLCAHSPLNGSDPLTLS